MKTTLLKKLIKESVKEAIQEELKEVLLEAVRAPKPTSIQENRTITSTTQVPVVQSPPAHSLMDKKKAYMDVLGETAINLNSSHAQNFNSQPFKPQGNVDTTSPNGQLPGGEVNMDQIMGLMTNR